MVELKDAEQQNLNYIELFIFYSQRTEIRTCVDKIFAIREMRLNPYIGFAQYAGGDGTIRISDTGTMIDSEFSSAEAFCVTKPTGTTHTMIQIYLK